MSVSTDGILVFGVDFGDSTEGLPWHEPYDEEGLTDEESDTRDDKNFENFVYQTAGVPSMGEHWKEFYAWFKGYKNGDWEHDNDGVVEKYESINPVWKKRYDEIYAQQRAALEECPIEEVTHCSYEYPMYIYAVKGYNHSASRGYPETITSIEVKPEDLARAQDWCKKAAIPFENPHWILTSLWG